MVQFGGLAIMPFALLVLSGGGNASQWPAWIGQAGAGIAFLLVGAGLHTTQTAGLALATDLAPVESQPKVVGLMYVMLLLGTIVSALVFGAAAGRLQPGPAGAGHPGCRRWRPWCSTSWPCGSRRRATRRVVRPRGGHASFRESWRQLIRRSERQLRRLIAIGLGTMAFSMQDVLLEPYGGQVLGMSVGATTTLTATLAHRRAAGLRLGFGRAEPRRRSLPHGRWRRAAGHSGLRRRTAGGAVDSMPLFGCGVLLIGLGGGIFSHGTLTATMNSAPKEQTGLALGAWGAVQATAAGVAVALGGIGRDVVSSFADRGYFGPSLAVPATGYAFVYSIEMALLVATTVVMATLIGSQPTRTQPPRRP